MQCFEITAFYHFSLCGLTGGLSWGVLMLVSLTVSQAVTVKWQLGLDSSEDADLR